MQLLVRIKDKISSDPSKNIELTKRGDVIVVKKDNEEWGIAELTNAEWRIISCPNMSELEANALVVSEGAPKADPQKPLFKRLFKFNLDNLQAKSVIDAPRQTDVANKLSNDLVIALSDLQAVKEQKAIIPNPKIMGPADNLILG